jgi:hypothetical protein
MTIVDDRGRLFGRVNIVDGAMIAFLILLIPLAYASYLLFRPTAPTIDSVEPTAITKEEERISAGGRLVAKFKVRGTGFTPLLRARIGDTDALGFVFEDPNSADLLVGPVRPGAHDLVLYDGVQEVARAAGAISVQPPTTISIRAVGWIINLEPAMAESLKAGMALPAESPTYEITALGPPGRGRTRVSLAGSTAEIPSDRLQERAAVITLRCGAITGDDPCTLGERLEYQRPPVTIRLPGPSGPFSFAIDELLPATPPVKATVTIRLASDSAAVREGDRDDLLDERSAVVTNVSGSSVTLALGVDAGRDGWRYRSQRLVPGAPFVLSTSSYVAHGRVQAVNPHEQPK